MAYKTGKANGYKEMLLALKGFLTNAKKAYNCQAGVGNTGTGYVSAERASTSPVDETWTLTATSANNFTVTGSVSGAQSDATVGTAYDNGIVAFLIVAGSTAFVATDSFTFDVADGLGATQKYTVKSWNTDWDGNGNYELILMAPGTAGTDEIFTGIQTYHDTGDDYFNWRLQGYTGYSAGQSFNNHPGAMTDAPNYNPKLLLWDTLLSYWLVASGRRFVLVVKVSTVYEAMYAGFILPYGLPNQIPYPLAIGGTCRAYDLTERRWSNTAVTHRAFVDPYSSSGAPQAYATLRLLHAGTWLHAGNWSSETSPIYSTCINVWPFIHSNYDAPGGPILNDCNGKWYFLEPNIDGSYPLFPCVVNAAYPELNFHGELQGCFALPGHQLSAEDIVQAGGSDYIAFPNIWRTNTWQYWALKME